MEEGLILEELELKRGRMKLLYDSYLSTSSCWRGPSAFPLGRTQKTTPYKSAYICQILVIN
jgi:hypothetical protein